jgi:hypothetical protein
MFTATTTKKDFRGGIFQVTVDFTDGTEVITEAFNITSGDDLDRRIEDRLNTLNRLLDLKTSLILGAWTKPVKEEPVADPVQEALNAVYKAKSDLDLKLITQAEYDAAVLAYKTLASGEVKPK